MIDFDRFSRFWSENHEITKNTEKYEKTEKNRKNQVYFFLYTSGKLKNSIHLPVAQTSILRWYDLFSLSQTLNHW